MRRRTDNRKKARGNILWTEMLPTPLGAVWLSFSEQGLQRLHFDTPAQIPGPLWPVDRLDTDWAARLRRWRQETAAACQAYFAGTPDSFASLTLDLRGTAFQIRVWQTLRRVPFGSVTTYQTLARAVGLLRGARAVGAALRANPLPIIIPCHRVVASSGSLGGYSAGLHYKRALLSHERQATGQSPLPLTGPVQIS